MNAVILNCSVTNTEPIFKEQMQANFFVIHRSDVLYFVLSTSKKSINIKIFLRLFLIKDIYIYIYTILFLCMII